MKKIISAAVILIFIDAFVHAIPGAVAMVKNNHVLPYHEQIPIKNFIGALLFHSVMYIIYVTPIYGLLISIYVLVQSAEWGRTIHTAMAALIVLAFYLIYSYVYSVDWALDNFYLKIAWYTMLGGFFGWRVGRR